MNKSEEFLVTRQKVMWNPWAKFCWHLLKLAESN